MPPETGDTSIPELERREIVNLLSNARDEMLSVSPNAVAERLCYALSDINVSFPYPLLEKEPFPGIEAIGQDIQDCLRSYESLTPLLSLATFLLGDRKLGGSALCNWIVLYTFLSRLPSYVSRHCTEGSDVHTLLLNFASRLRFDDAENLSILPPEDQP